MRPSASYRAVIVGGSGAVGGAVVRALLHSERCGHVLAIVRRPVAEFDALPHRDKLDLAVVDFAELERETSARAAGFDVAFCTVGIGQPRKVSDEVFRRVDVEYAGAFARGAATAGARYIALLSSVGSDAASRNRYLRVKGNAERAVIAAGIARTSIFRPSLLATDEIRYGLQDRVTQTLFPLVSPLLPRRYHEIHVDALGRAMQLDAERERAPGVEYLYYPDFMALDARTAAV
jgi:uncharacterized protein YbjT (DUF2867 family)